MGEPGNLRRIRPFPISALREALGSGPGSAFSRFGPRQLLPEPQFAGLQTGDGDGIHLITQGNSSTLGQHMLRLLAPSPWLQQVVTMSTASGAVDQPAHPISLCPLCDDQALALSPVVTGDWGLRSGLSVRSHLCMYHPGHLASCPGKGRSVGLGKLRRSPASAIGS